MSRRSRDDSFLDVSVLFLDISAYARLSAQLPPDMLNQLVERSPQKRAVHAPAAIGAGEAQVSGGALGCSRRTSF
jgi:class 3 adenylate cyclase